jgi:FkbM family methyltransferase
MQPDQPGHRLGDSVLFGPVLSRLAAAIAELAVPLAGGAMEARLTALESALVQIEGLVERVVPLGDRVLALTAAGQRIFLDARDLSVTPHIALLGIWETEVERLLRRLLRPGQRVVEVGANIGYHTLAMAAAIGPAGRLDAFEANPETAALLAATIEVNGLAEWVHLHAAAALDAPGTVEFALHPTHRGAFHRAVAETTADFTGRLRVPALTLDAALGTEGPPVDLLRIDAEGSEPLALRGAAGLIAASPGLILVTEWAPALMAPQADVPGFADWLLDQGFAPGRILPDSTLAPLHRAGLLALDHAEVVFRRYTA